MKRFSKLADFLWLSVVNLKSRKTRTFLTLIGIFIGIAAVVALISLSQGLQNAITGEIQRVGADKLVVTAGKDGNLLNLPFAVSKLDEGDLNAVKRALEVQEAGPAMVVTARTWFKGETRQLQLNGIPVNSDRFVVEEFYDVNAVEGVKLPQSGGAKVLIGSEVAAGNAFTSKVKVKDTLIIEGKVFKVIGVFKKTGDPEYDRGLVVPIQEVKTLFPKASYFLIVAKIKGTSPKEAVPNVEKQLRRQREVKEGSEDFTVQTTDQLFESFANILSLVQVIVIGIAAISLIVGGVGITNTMYTSVLERTREIGVMKSIGAKNRDVLAVFLIEAGLLGLLGGVMGLAIGLLVAKLVEYAAFNFIGTNLLQAAISIELLASALIFSFLIGAISGFLPAREATAMQPLEALNYGG